MDTPGVNLRTADPPDIPLVSAMAERIWREHYIPIIGEKQVNYMLEKMYSGKSLLEQMNDGQLFLLAYVSLKPIGYISISKKNESEFFMHKFYMEIQEQGKGYGKKIFSEILFRFPELKTMHLQVNRMNYKSVNFYFGLGFRIEEAMDFDIGEGYLMQDFVMVYKSPTKKI